MLTDEEKQKINLAMEQAGGSAKVAAEILGMTRTKLANTIKCNKDLKLRWIKSRDPVKPLGDSEAFCRPTPPVPPIDPLAVAKSDAEMAQALENENKKLLKDGLEGMGLSEDAVKEALALQNFMGKNFVSAIQLIGGGVTDEFLRIKADLRRIREQLEALEYAGDENDVAVAMRENGLRQHQAKLLEILGKTFDRVNRAALTQAIVQQKRAAAQNGGAGGMKRAGKPGFGPIVLPVEGRPA